MVMAVVLAGGTGSRLGGDIPKQYLMAGDKPVIGYCLETFENNKNIDDVLVVCAKEWRDFVRRWITTLKIRKFCGFAEAGECRQHSIYHALQEAKRLGLEEDDVVLIHDAARPWVDDKLIDGCISATMAADGAMPVISMKDTVYLSRNGSRIDGLLCRDELFAGQAPESFRFGPYYRLHETLSTEELAAIRGSSEIAYRGGMEIRLVAGSEENYKITTQEDLDKFRLQITEKGGKGR